MTQATTIKSLRPLGDRLLVRPQRREEMTKRRILRPDTIKEKPQQGSVIAVGQGKILESGERQPMEIQEGNTVLFAKYAGTEFDLDGEDVLILRESDVLGILS